MALYKTKLISTLSATLAVAALLSGCQPKEKIDPRAGGGGLTGNWVSADNVFTASLNNGTFTARANDTGEEISSGTYFVVSAKQVNLAWRGNVTNRDNTATCQRSSDTVLNCTDAGGKTFTLNKVLS